MKKVVNFVRGNEYTVRAAALATDDSVLRGVMLSLIDETEDEAYSALSLSCWAEDLHSDPIEQRAALRAAIMSAVPNNLRPMGWPGGTQFPE